MTNEEIKKYLECNCKFATCEQCEINYTIKQAILDLIERQENIINDLRIIEKAHKQENGELRKEYDKLKYEFDVLDKELERVEAIEEKYDNLMHKLKNKIEELEKEYNQFVEWDREDDCFITREIIGILEELLEEE